MSCRRAEDRKLRVLLRQFRPVDGSNQGDNNEAPNTNQRDHVYLSDGGKRAVPSIQNRMLERMKNSIAIAEFVTTSV